ncbi:MAG TPA: hypothetical protein VLA03_10235, partial [Draconibacterium sp.]|nr:hypothetical protein [Draconibacterium sp.]
IKPDYYKTVNLEQFFFSPFSLEIDLSVSIWQTQILNSAYISIHIICYCGFFDTFYVFFCHFEIKKLSNIKEMLTDIEI